MCVTYLIPAVHRAELTDKLDDYERLLYAEADTLSGNGWNPYAFFDCTATHSGLMSEVDMLSLITSTQTADGYGAI